MQDFSGSPMEMVKSICRNRALVGALIKRDVVGRYRGSIMGIVWSFLHPVFMLSVYTFVFSFVFKARWNTGGDSKAEFALVLFAGLLVFNVFSECVNKSPSLILGNVNYVKKVVFPLEVLPWVAMGAALFHGLVSLLVWMLAYIFMFGMPHLTALWLPLVVVPLVFLIMGVCWFLSALGVYLRDTAQVVGIITMTLMFVSPIFYPSTALPPEYRNLLYLNPLTPIIEQARAVLFWGNTPDFKLLAIYLVCSLLLACAGFAWFQKTRKGFADVL